jgi:hypothetical protein
MAHFGREQQLAQHQKFTRSLLRVLVLSIPLLALLAHAQHIHQLTNNPSWENTDLTMLTGAPDPVLGAGSAFYFVDNNGNVNQHIVFVSSTNNHIYEIAYDALLAQWGVSDDTKETKGIAAYNGTNSGQFPQLSAFVLNSAEYIYFCGVDGAIHEYSFNDNGNLAWNDTALPVTAGACNQDTDLNANSFAWVLGFAGYPGSQRYVFYLVPSVATGTQAEYADVVQLYYNGSAWSSLNVTKSIKGGVRLSQFGTAAGFADENNAYIFFSSAADKSIYEYTNASGAWAQSEVTASGTVQTSGVNGAMLMFTVPHNTQFVVYYTAQNPITRKGQLQYDLHQLNFASNKWVDTDITKAIGIATESQPFVIPLSVPLSNDRWVFTSSVASSPGSAACLVDVGYGGSGWSYTTLPACPTDGDVAGGEVFAGFIVGPLPVPSQYLYAMY